VIAVRRSEIVEENQRMLERQRQFRIAADLVTDVWIKSAEVHQAPENSTLSPNCGFLTDAPPAFSAIPPNPVRFVEILLAYL
jgi:hypothetical protein